MASLMVAVLCAGMTTAFAAPPDDLPKSPPPCGWSVKLKAEAPREMASDSIDKLWRVVIRFEDSTLFAVELSATSVGHFDGSISASAPPNGEAFAPQAVDWSPPGWRMTRDELQRLCSSGFRHSATG